MELNKDYTKILGTDNANTIDDTNSTQIDEIEADMTTIETAVTTAQEDITTLETNNTGTNTGDNAANTTYASDYRASNFSAGTDYLAPDGDGSGLSGVVTAETDPIVGAITGIVKADGAGAISAALSDTDYQSVLTEGAFADGDKTKLDTVDSNADVTGSNAPQAHATSHTDGSDDIQSATSLQKGLATSTQISKLDGIAAGAEVNTVDSVNTQTGAVVLDADDIDDSATTNKFVTAGDITKLGNLSGTNTGDQDIDDITPTTTKGDLIVENGSNAVRLAAGSNTQVLTANSATATGLEWSAPGTPGAHASSHEDGGADEISVAGLSGDLADAQSETIKKIYPVGSIYISTLSTNPNTLLGFGTWVAFGEGKVLVGLDSGDTDFDTSEETGGSKTHTLIEAEIPSHRHDGVISLKDATTSAGTDVFGGASGGTNGSRTIPNVATGGDGAHNNVQPYIVVYMWKRTV